MIWSQKFLVVTLAAAAVATAAGLAVPDTLDRELARLNDGSHVLSVIRTDQLIHQRIVPRAEIKRIDRDRLLNLLFQRVAGTEGSTEERVLAWLRYVQMRVAHPKWPPMHDKNTMVLDPLWILENRIAHCGQVNRTLADGLLAVGIDARIVQLDGHVAAEAWFDGQWRFLDADWLHDGEVVRRADGQIPSAEEIFDHHEWLDGLHPVSEWAAYGVDISHDADTFARPVDRYKATFTRKEVSGLIVPYYYVKTATAEQRRDAYYGWLNYKTTP